jgi:UDP-N-acetylmuramate--alanine ligase
MQSHFSMSFQGRDLGRFEVMGAGRHNVLNAAASALVGLELGATADQIREGLRGFIGVDRRFQIRGERAGVTVVDDYGHHPTEIRATLSAARNCGFRRIHVIFQPHRYSRTELLEAEFAACFPDCDTLEVVDIYAASEEPRPGVNSIRLVEKIREAGGPAEYAPSTEEAVARVTARAQPGDAVVTLGAGSISRAGESILAVLSRVEEGAARNATP